MERAPWLYTLMQIALWSIHGVLISYAQRYLAGMGMRDSAIGLLLGGATAAGDERRTRRTSLSKAHPREIGECMICDNLADLRAGKRLLSNGPPIPNAYAPCLEPS